MFARTGNMDGAAKEAQTSLGTKRNAQAYVALAAAQLNQKKLSDAATNVSAALAMEPANVQAQLMKVTLTKRGVQVP